MGPLIPLFWTSGEVYPGFQSQGGSLTCVLPRLRTTDVSDSALAWHLPTSWRPAWQLVAFLTCIVAEGLKNFVVVSIIVLYNTSHEPLMLLWSSSCFFFQNTAVVFPIPARTADAARFKETHGNVIVHRATVVLHVSVSIHKNTTVILPCGRL